jgi:transposase
MIEYDWIWLNMIEYAWIWLNMIEYDWIWLNMIEYDWIWLNMRIVRVVAHFSSITMCTETIVYCQSRLRYCYRATVIRSNKQVLFNKID